MGPGVGPGDGVGGGTGGGVGTHVPSRMQGGIWIPPSHDMKSHVEAAVMSPAASKRLSFTATTPAWPLSCGRIRRKE